MARLGRGQPLSAKRFGFPWLVPPPQIFQRGAVDALGSTTVLDTFTDASAPRDLTTYNPAWSAPAFGGEAIPKTTLSGGVINTSGGPSSAYYPSVSQADVRVFATVATRPADGGVFELLARLQNPGGAQNCYALVGFANAGTDSIELYQFTSGVGTFLGIFQSADYNVGDTFALDVSGVSPFTIATAYKNGVLIGTVSNLSFVNGAGSIGFRLNDNVAVLGNFGVGQGTFDVATRAPGTRTRSALDTLDTSDVATRAPFTQTKTAADTLATTDVATRLATYPRTASDSLGTTDNAVGIAIIGVQSRTGTDSLGTSDSATRVSPRTRTAGDSLATSDAATRVLPLVRTASDILLGPTVTTDDFSIDTIATGAWTNFGFASAAISSGHLTGFGAGSTPAGLRWTAQGSSSAIRKFRIKFSISSGVPMNGAACTPAIWLDQNNYIRPYLRFVSGSDERFSLYKYDAGVNSLLLDGTSKTQAAWTVAGVWTGEIERNGDVVTARVWFPGLNPDIDPATGIVSHTLIGADKTKFGAGVNAYMALATESTVGYYDDAALYEQVSDTATRGPILRIRTAVDSLGTSDVATRTFARARMATDSLGTADVATQLRISPRTATDTLGTSDAASRTTQVAVRTATDSLAPSGYALAQRDDFTTDTRSNWSVLSGGGTSATWTGTTWSFIGGAFGYIAAPVTWGNASDKDRVRILGRFQSDGMIACGFVLPGSLAFGSSVSAQLQSSGVIKTFYDGGTSSAQTTNSTVPGTALNTYYILEYTRNGNSYTVAIYDSTGTTLLFTDTKTFTGSPATAYGTSIPLRPMLSLANASEADWFEYSSPVVMDVATRGPFSPSRTATDSLGTTDVATQAKFFRAAADTLGTSDVASRSARVAARTASDTLGTADAATRTLPLVRTASDQLTPSGYTVLQRDDFNTDSRGSYSAVSPGIITPYYTGSALSTNANDVPGKYYMAAPAAWGSANDQARLRCRGKWIGSFPGNATWGLAFLGVGGTTPLFYAEFAGDEPSWGSVVVSMDALYAFGGTNLVASSNFGASLAAGTYYILEFTRNGNSFTVTCKNDAETTTFFTTTTAIPSGNQARYGAGVSLRPVIMMRQTGFTISTQVDWFEYSSPVLADVATRGPVAPSRTAADTLGTTDVATSVFIAGGPVQRTATDALATSDSATRTAVFTRNAPDTLGTSDAATRVPGVRIRSGADTLGTADVATKLGVLPRVAIDSLATTDVAARALLIRVRTAQDTLATTDVATSVRVTLKTASDTLGTADIATRLEALTKTASDALGTTDLATRTAFLFRTAVDALGTTDLATRTRLAPRTASDTLGTTDTVTRVPYIRVRTAVDTLGTADTALKGGVSAPSAVDSLGTTDFVTRTAFVHKTSADTLGTSDVATRIVLRSKTATDTLGTSDVAVRTRVAPRVAVDTLGTTDLVTRVAFVRKTGIDTLGTSDVATRVALLSRIAADLLGTIDTASRTRAASRTATDTLGTSDAVTRVPQVFFRIVSDTLGTSDLVTGVKGKVRTATDTITLSDSASRTIQLAKLAFDTLGTTDTSVIYTVQARTAEDTLGTLDSVVAFPFYPVTASDTLGTTDEVVISIDYTRVGSDRLGTFDLATRVVIAGPQAFTGFRFVKSPGSFLEPAGGSFKGFNPGKFTYKGN